MKRVRRSGIALATAGLLAVGLLVPPGAGAVDEFWDAPVSLSAPGSTASARGMTVSGNGRSIIATWSRYNGNSYVIRAALSNDRGRTWTRQRLSPRGNRDRAFGPVTGMSAKGRTIVVAWQQRLKRNRAVVRTRISHDRGTTWLKRRLSPTTMNSKRQQLSVSADGRTIMVAWIRYDTSERTGYARARVSTDGGASWTKRRLSGPHQTASDPQVAVSANGSTLVATWDQSTRSNRLVHSAISTDHGRTWTERIRRSAGPMSYANRAAVSADGRTIANAWQSYDGLAWATHAETSTDAGTTWSHQALSTANNAGSSPGISVSADGSTIAATWQQSEQNDTILARISTDSGRTWSLRRVSARGRDSSSADVDVSADGRTITTTWVRYDGVNQIARAGTSTDSGRTWARRRLSTTGYEANRPLVGVSADGNLIAATWRRGEGRKMVVRARIRRTPFQARYQVRKHDRTQVSWTAAARATGYRVTVNGTTRCRRGPSALGCTFNRAYGPRAKVRVIALGGASNPAATTAHYRRAKEPIGFGTVHFRVKSAKLTTGSKTRIRKKTTALVRQGFGTAEVYGYTARECRPKKLSRQRATTVQRVMKKRLRAMDATMRIRISAMGNRDPIADNNTKPGRAKNRRATISIR